MKTQYEILRYFPEWEKYSTRIGGQFTFECLSISIPSPTNDNEKLVIDAEDDSVIIYFGCAHEHFDDFMYENYKQMFHEIREMTDKIFNEELIAIEHRLFLFLKGGGFCDVNEYAKQLKDGKLLEACSWKGTYNYIKPNKK